MEMITIILLVVNFAFLVVAIFLIMNVTSALKTQNYNANLFKSQFSYLYERMDEVRDRVDKTVVTQKEELTKFQEDIKESINKARNENLRELDGIKYALRNIAPPKRKPDEDTDPLQPPQRQRTRM